MSSFYEKLSMKLQEQGGGEEGGGHRDQVTQATSSSSRTVTYSATGEQKSSPKPDHDDKPPAQPAPDVVPDGTDPIDIDLFQSDLRMVIFLKVSGVAADGFDITVSDESNTIIVEAIQKRPSLPLAKGAKEGDQPEKGIYAKAEIKWKTLYRKIYLPAPFDSGEVTAVLDKGVLIITLPAKHPGAGKKLVVQEIQHDGEKSVSNK